MHPDRNQQTEQQASRAQKSAFLWKHITPVLQQLIQCFK
jgi:hypothetical protein